MSACPFPPSRNVADALAQICLLDRAATAYAAKLGGEECLAIALAAARRVVAELTAESAAVAVGRAA